jgi:ABC-type transport system involved in Fe-S cluster assembly fused permease/ATPase subunit
VSVSRLTSLDPSQYFNNEKMEAERYDKYFEKYSAASLKTNVRYGSTRTTAHAPPHTH